MLNMALDTNAQKARKKLGRSLSGDDGGVGGDFDDGGAPLALEDDPPPLGFIPDPLGALQP